MHKSPPKAIFDVHISSDVMKYLKTLALFGVDGHVHGAETQHVTVGVVHIRTLLD